MACGYIDNHGRVHQREDCQHAKDVAADNFGRGYIYYENDLPRIGSHVVPLDKKPREEVGRRVARRGDAEAASRIGDISQVNPASPTIVNLNGIIIVAVLGFVAVYLLGWK